MLLEKNEAVVHKNPLWDSGTRNGIPLDFTEAIVQRERNETCEEKKLSSDVSPERSPTSVQILGGFDGLMSTLSLRPGAAADQPALMCLRRESPPQTFAQWAPILASWSHLSGRRGDFWSAARLHSHSQDKTENQEKSVFPFPYTSGSSPPCQVAPQVAHAADSRGERLRLVSSPYVHRLLFHRCSSPLHLFELQASDCCSAVAASGPCLQVAVIEGNCQVPLPRDFEPDHSLASACCIRRESGVAVCPSRPRARKGRKLNPNSQTRLST